MRRVIQPRIIVFALAGLILLCLFLSGLSDGFGERGGGNLYLHQAKAFLSGRLDIVTDSDIVDIAFYDAGKFVVFPPFPSLVMIPFVAVWGVEGVHAVYVSLLLSALLVLALRDMLRRVGVVDSWNRFWIISAFMMGTGYWYCVSMSYEVFFLAHIVAVACMVLCIREAFAGGRGILCGLLLAAAFLSRQMSLYMFFFIAAVLWVRSRDEGWKRSILNLISFALTFFMAGICLYLAYNWLRFGNPLETGYQYIPLRGFLKERVELYGQFNIRYLPFNLQKMFFQGFNVFYTGPARLTPNIDTFGTSLTYASPFLFYAFRAKTSRLIYWMGLLSVLLCIVHQSLYYNNGYVQINCNRFALDYLPVLIAMVGMSLKEKGCSGLFAGLAIYSVALNAVALVLLPMILR